MASETNFTVTGILDGHRISHSTNRTVLMETAIVRAQQLSGHLLSTIVDRAKGKGTFRLEIEISGFLEFKVEDLAKIEEIKDPEKREQALLSLLES